MTFRYLRAFLLVGLGLLLVSCSITRVKWRIKWDKDKEKGKEAFMSAPLETQDKERQPNVIILLADDLGPYEVSAYGVEHISTPHIDQIGAEGVVFEQLEHREDLRCESLVDLDPLHAVHGQIAGAL